MIVGFLLGLSIGLFTGMFFVFRSMLIGEIKYDLVKSDNSRRTNFDGMGDPKIDPFY